MERALRTTSGVRYPDISDIRLCGCCGYLEVDMPASSRRFKKRDQTKSTFAARNRLRSLFYVGFYVGHSFNFDLLTTNRIANSFDTVRTAPADHHLFRHSRCLGDHGLFAGFDNFESLVLPVDILGELRIGYRSTCYFAMLFMQGDLLLYRLLGYEATNPGFTRRNLSLPYVDLLLSQAYHFFSYIGSRTCGWRRSRGKGGGRSVKQILRTVSVQNIHRPIHVCVGGSQ